MTEQPTMTEQPVGEVTHFYQDIGVAIIRAEEPIELGDELHVQGANDDFSFEVSSMEVDHESVEKAEPGTEIGVKVPERAHEGSDVFKVT